MFDPSEPSRGYAVVWPKDLVRRELTTIVNRLPDREQRPALEVLLSEALAGPEPLEDLDQVPSGPDPDPWSGLHAELVENSCRVCGRQLLALVDQLPVHVPRSYYLDREFTTATGITLDQHPAPPGQVRWASLRKEWIEVVKGLVERGYLDRVAGDRCEDGRENEQPGRITHLLVERSGLPAGLRPMWPLDPSDPPLANELVLFTLIEVFHDLVARPRRREWHAYDEHYRYSRFDTTMGQAVYRAQVNKVLAWHGVELELAETGEDQGLLVRRVLDPRQELLTRVPTEVEPSNQGRVEHAIALFRGRAATVETKRSACEALYMILEERTRLLTKVLHRKDESALSQIANEFGVRHQNAKQYTDFDEAYLDWIFWWFLGTIELSNRLLAKRGTP